MERGQDDERAVSEEEFKAMPEKIERHFDRIRDFLEEDK